MLDKSLSKSISALRMPLAFLVICVHADFTKNFSYAGEQVICSYDWGYHVVNFISHTLSEIAVPLFYFISGTLCFHSLQKYGYRKLIQNKIRTLLVSYMMWNSIFFVCFFISKGYNFVEFLEGLWAIPKGEYFGLLTQPWDGPLWFLRDLMVMFLLVPIAIYITRSARWGVMVLFALYATKIFSWYLFPGLSITCIFMFSLGLQLQQISYKWFEKIVKYRYVLCVCCLILMLVVYYTNNTSTTSIGRNIFHSISIILGITAVLALVGSNKLSYNLNKVGKNTFVIFASHTLFLNYIIKIIMVPFGHYLSGFKTVFIFLTSVVATYIISYLLGYVFSKNKWTNRILSGGR